MKKFDKSFLGIQPYDKKLDLLQCLECGEWYKALNYLHLRIHYLTPTTYKQKYGINRRQALVSLATRKKSSLIGHKYGRANLRPAPEVGGGMLGRLNPRRKQTLIKRHPQYKEMAQKAKRMWKENKFEHLRELRSKLAKSMWDKTSYEERLKRTRPARSVIHLLTGTDSLTKKERELK